MKRLIVILILALLATLLPQDKAGAVTTDDRVQEIAALYRAILDRGPDAPGLQYWYNTSLDIPEIAAYFLRSPEFEARIASDIDADTIAQVYTTQVIGSIRVVRMPFEGFDFRVVRDDAPRLVGHFPDATVSINGGWFLNGAPQETTVVDGDYLTYKDYHAASYFFYDTGEIRFRALGEAHLLGPGLHSVVSGHPSLVRLGVSEVTRQDFLADPVMRQRATRSAVGRTPTEMLFVTAKSKTAQEMADLMISLGARDALMLDGGGSSAIAYGGNRYGGSRLVDHQLIATRKEG